MTYFTNVQYITKTNSPTLYLYYYGTLEKEVHEVNSMYSWVSTWVHIITTYRTIII